MYNRVILMGRLTADPELRQTQSGISMCRITIAVDRSFAKQGEERKTDFFDITFWRQQAEFVSRYFSKGRVIHVEGRLQNDNYTDQNGQKHYRTSIVADNVSFCGDKRPDSGNGGYSAPNYNNNNYQYGNAPQQGYNSAPQYQQPQGGYQGNAPQNYGQPAPQPAMNSPMNSAPKPIELGNLDDFEEVLSDGEVPF